MTSLNVNTVDPLALLRQDHEQVRVLFTSFAKARGDNAQLRIISEALAALAVHAAIEEQLFYPAARSLVADPQIIDGAIAEHAAVQGVIDEIAQSHDATIRADKFRVLMQLVEAHASREENEIFPQCEGWGARFGELGAQLEASKQELTRVGRFL